MAPALADHPEGVNGNECGKLIDLCEEFVEVTGEVGDYILLHPYMLHALGVERYDFRPTGAREERWTVVA